MCKNKRIEKSEWMLLSYAIEDEFGIMPKSKYKFITPVSRPVKNIPNLPWGLFGFATSREFGSIPSFAPSKRRLYNVWEEVILDYEMANDSGMRVWACLWHPALERAMYFPFKPNGIYPTKFYPKWCRNGYYSTIFYIGLNEPIFEEKPYI